MILPIQKRSFISLTVYCLLFTVRFLSAQQYHFTTYTAADGLAGSSINHIFQDSKGYIWFATQGGGISCFNGKDFKNLTKADGLINNDVTYLTEDNQGHLWIGTAAGASEYNGHSFTNYNARNGLTNGVVYCIYCNELNEIWFATNTDGIKVLQNGSFRTINGLSSNETYTIARDKQGTYWFGLANGIARLSNQKITNYNQSREVTEHTFFSSLIDSKGQIWFGSTSGEVLTVLPNKDGAEIRKVLQFANQFIGGMAYDKNGNLWLASDKGLIKHNSRETIQLTEQQGLSANAMQTVLCDYEGNIWGGTLGGGVNLLSSEAFVHYTEKSGLQNQNVTCLARSQSGNYFVGTNSGLYIFSTSSPTPFSKINSVKQLQNSNIASVCIDKKDRLWVAAQDELYVLKQIGNNVQLEKTYTHIAGIKLISPTKVICTQSGVVWVASYGTGLFSLKRSIEKNFNQNTPGLGTDNVLTLFEDRQNNLWIGTYDKGAVIYNGTDFAPIKLTGQPQTIWSICQDNKAHLFFGTTESGLYMYNGKTNINYRSRHGLNSDYITSLEWDNAEQCLWAASEKSLDKITFTASGNIENIRSFKTTDGFSSAGINQSGIYCDLNGLTWLCGADGLWRYNSKADAPRNIAPKVQLSGIRLFYQPLSLDSITGNFAHNKNHLTFDIQALTTQQVLYRFYLEGLDNSWSLPQKNNAVTYSNIPPGSYTFKAKAVTQAGVESAQTVTFSFRIKPPWWQTWWFYTLSIAGIAALLMLFIKTREQVLHERNIKLEQTVNERTNQIVKQKELVEKMLHEKELLLKEIHHRVKNNLQTISSMLMLQSAGLKDEAAKKAITESQSRVRSIALVHQKLYQTEGLEKVELNGFINDLIGQIQSLYRFNQYSVNIQVNVPETFILIDKAIPLGLIINELLTNSYKYAFNQTHSGTIQITLSHNTFSQNESNRKLILTYSDSGPGLSSVDMWNNASTLGLRLIKILSQQIGASCTYENNSHSMFIFIFTNNL